MALAQEYRRGLVQTSSRNWVPQAGNADGSMNVATTGTALDAFARTRMSEPETIFDSKQIFDNLPLVWDDQEVSGSGTTSVHSVNKAATTMGVANLTAGNRTRQTFMRFNYQPGKSQLILMTARMSASADAGIKGSVGIYDDENGVFFTNDGGTMKAVTRSYVTGSAVDTEITQANWNGDKLDGAGASGATLSALNTQILFFDMEWLGVGNVRMGFFIDGIPVVAHTFRNANAMPVVYMSTPNLPLRYEIENDGTGGAVDMDHICSTVISEGGAEDRGILRYVSTAGTHVDCNVVNTIYAIVGIRLKATHLGASIKIQRINMQIQTASETGEWIWILNPTVAGSFTYADETDSAVQSAKGATANTVTNGTHITGGYGESTSGGGGSGGVVSPIGNAILLGSTISGTPDTMVLCWRPTTGTNQDIEGSITYRELV